jgi:hypothetical protein
VESQSPGFGFLVLGAGCPGRQAAGAGHGRGGGPQLGVGEWGRWTASASDWPTAIRVQWRAATMKIRKKKVNVLRHARVRLSPVLTPLHTPGPAPGSRVPLPGLGRRGHGGGGRPHRHGRLGLFGPAGGYNDLPLGNLLTQADRRSWPASIGFLGRHITTDSTLDSTDDSALDGPLLCPDFRWF